MRKTDYLLVLTLSALCVNGQTAIDLSTQARNIDFSKASATRPIKAGSTLPATCKIGELFFHTGQAPDRVLYACTATNVWTLQSGGGGTATVDIATQSEAEIGNDSTKVMTPERTRQAFQAWSPVPPPAGRVAGLLTTDGSTAQWSWNLTTPASGVQTLSMNSASIAADRLFVNVNPLTTMKLISEPVIVDGTDGQFLTITNVSSTHTLTLPDQGASNLRLGGEELPLAPGDSVSLVYSSVLRDWLVTQRRSGGASSVAAGMTGPASATDSQLALFSGTTGSALKTYTGTGLMQVSNGVPSTMTGTGLVQVTGGAASALSGDGLVQLSSGVASTVTGSGVVRVANGVPSALGGTGLVQVTAGAASAVSGSGLVQLSSGVASTVGGSGLVQVSNGTPSTVTGTGLLQLTAGAPSAVSGSGIVQMSNGVASTVSGTGIVRVSNGVPSTIAGTGLVQVTAGAPSAVTGSGLVQMSSGAASTLSGTGIVQVSNGAPSTLGGTGLLQLTAGAPSTVPGTGLLQLTAGAPSTLSGSGLLQMSSGVASTVTGSGVVQVSNGAPSTIAGTGLLQLTAGAPSTLSGSGLLQMSSGVASTVTGSGVVQVSNGAPSTIAGTGLLQLTDGAPSAVTGSGLLQMSSGVASTMTGTGLLQLTAGAPSMVTGTGVMRLNNGVPSLVTGAPTDFIRVDGSTASAPSGGSGVDRSIFTWSGSTTVVAGGTTYLSITGSAGATSSENNKSIVVPASGVLSRLFVHTTSTQNSDGSLDCVIRVNGVTPANGPAISITSSSTSPVSDTDRSVAVAAGDKVVLQCKNNAASTSAALAAVSIVFTF